MGERFVATTGFRQCAAEIAMRIGRRRQEINRALQVRERFGQPVGGEEQRADLLMRFREIRVELERPRVLDKRLLWPAGRGQHLGEIEVQVRILWRERGRAAEMGEGGRATLPVASKAPPR